MIDTYDLDTPALLVDLDILSSNIRKMADLVSGGGKRLRPHTKTHKCPNVAKMQCAAGAVGMTVAKLEEAEPLIRAGYTDLFVANQVVGSKKLERLFALLDSAEIRLGIDSQEVAEPIDIGARAHGVRVPVLIEVDTGLKRAGTRSVDEMLRLAQFVERAQGLKLVGIFTHEGHLYRHIDPVSRAAAAHQVAEQLELLVSSLIREGIEISEISAGSTPGARYLADEPTPTELRPGVYVFNDRMQMSLGVSVAECALSVLTTVISVRPDGMVFVDAGSKALAGDKPFSDQTCGLPLGHPELVFQGMSEEHGHLTAAGATSVRVGDRINIIPNHACTCVDLHDLMYACHGTTVEEVWPIAGRGKIR